MTKTILLAGAMALSFAAAPALAETLSTPSELDQTRALNSGATTGTYTKPAALNGHSDTSEPDAAPAIEPRSALNPDDFVALRTVDPDRLDGVAVQTADGTTIGRARHVRLGDDGAPIAVSVELNDGRDVRMSEESLRFDAKDKVLLTNMDGDQLRAASDVPR